MLTMNSRHTSVAQPPRKGENTMDKPGTNHQPAHQAVNDAATLQDVSNALFAMRDALTKLSLALKDWQFEHDLAKRDNVQGITQGLFASLAAPPKNKPDQAPL